MQHRGPAATDAVFIGVARSGAELHPSFQDQIANHGPKSEHYGMDRHRGGDGRLDRLFLRVAEPSGADIRLGHSDDTSIEDAGLFNADNLIA